MRWCQGWAHYDCGPDPGWPLLTARELGMVFTFLNICLKQNQNKEYGTKALYDQQSLTYLLFSSFQENVC